MIQNFDSVDDCNVCPLTKQRIPPFISNNHFSASIIATFLINRIATPNIKEHPPFEFLFHKSPHLTDLKVFDVWPLLPSYPQKRQILCSSQSFGFCGISNWISSRLVPFLTSIFPILTLGDLQGHLDHRRTYKTTVVIPQPNIQSLTTFPTPY